MQYDVLLQGFTKVTAFDGRNIKEKPLWISP